MAHTEVARYKYAQDLQGLPLLSASFRHQSFSRHVHEGYCIGVIEDGAQRFFRSGANHIASEDCIILVNPDQVHDGHAASENGWKYRAMYPLPSLVEWVRRELTDKSHEIAGFSDPVVSDRYMAARLRHLFSVLDKSDNTLQREGLFLDVMSELLKRHGQGKVVMPHVGNEPLAVNLMKEFLDGHFADNVSSEHLSQLTGLNPYYLNRLFQKHVGIPPHAYQVQRRLRRAKTLLENGESIAAAAAMSGFSDQSHLTRHFRRWLGVTPGQFLQTLLPRPMAQ